VRGDTPDGAADFYPGAVGFLGTMLATAAEHAASLLPAAARVLDAGAGAAPWSLAVAARDPACLVTAIDLPEVLPATRRAVTGAGRERQFRFLAGDLFDIELGMGPTTWRSPATSATCSATPPTAACSAGCTTRFVPAGHWP
jgi:CTP:molybdopterin cytidylyltransferase MocA